MRFTCFVPYIIKFNKITIQAKIDPDDKISWQLTACQFLFLCEAYDVTGFWHHSHYNLLIKSARTLNHSKVSMCHSMWSFFVSCICNVHAQNLTILNSYEWINMLAISKVIAPRKILLISNTMLQNYCAPCHFHQITLVQIFKVKLKNIQFFFYWIKALFYDCPQTMGKKIEWSKNIPPEFDENLKNYFKKIPTDFCETITGLLNM